MKKLSLITALFFCSLLYPQIPTFQWVKSIGGSTTENGVYSVVDASGNLYTTGSFQGTADFDPGAGISNLTSAGGKDVFLQKLDAQGNFVWAKRFGGAGNDIATFMHCSNSDEIYITGNFEGTVDFDPNSAVSYQSSMGGSDIFLEKLSTDGNLIMVLSMGGLSGDLGGYVKTDASGNIYLAHSFSGLADVDPGRDQFNLLSQGSLDICVEKLNPLGDFLWGKSIGGSGMEKINGLAIDAGENIYMTGSFEGASDFDPGNSINTHIALGVRDVFIEKINADGTMDWVKCHGNIGGTNEASSISLDMQGNPIVTGTFEGTINYSIGESATSYITSAGETDIFVEKINSSGDSEWMKAVGGSKSEKSKCIYTDFSGTVYLTGEYERKNVYIPVDYDKTSSSTEKGCFIKQIDANGNIQWTKELKNTTGVWINSIISDYSNNLYLSGKFSSTVDFNTENGINNVSATGTESNYTLKLGQGITSLNDMEQEEVLNLYPNPAKNYLKVNLPDKPELVKVIMYDVLGNIVLENEFRNENEFAINFNLNSGIYYINLLMKDKKVTEKIIVE